MYSSFGKPFVHPDFPGTSLSDVSGSEFGVADPTSEEDVQRKRALKSSFKAFFES